MRRREDDFSDIIPESTVIFEIKSDVNTLPVDRLLEENTVIADMLNKQIEDSLCMFGYGIDNIRSIIESNKIAGNDRMILNYNIRRLSEDFDIRLKDIVLYLSQFNDVEKIVNNILDDTTRCVLKFEMATEYNYDIDETEYLF